MRKIITRLLAITILGSMFLLPASFMPMQHAYATTDSAEACKAIEQAGGPKCNDGTSESGLKGLVRTTITIISWVIGVAAVIMIIVGGLRYVTSNGESNSVTSAKNTIMYALIGLAVAALAQVIVRFVLTKTTV